MRTEIGATTDLVQAASDFRVVFGRILRRLRQAHVTGELTLSERSLLSRLDRDGPSTPGALADEERVRPQVMGAIVATLADRGFITRTADPGDGRRVLMDVSSEGRKVLVDRRSVNTQQMAKALECGFNPAERRRLIAVIPLLERLAEEL